MVCLLAGWYSRVTADNDSIGFICGSFPDQTSIAQPTYVGVIYSDNTVPNAKLQSWEASIPLSDFQVNKDGKAITSDPDFPSPPDFKVSFKNQGASGYFSSSGDNTNVTLFIPGDKPSSKGVQLSMQITGPAQYWGPNGEGPEGWAGRLPFLGLQWFVYSLASPVQYTIVLPDGNERSGRGFVHQEKNWGAAFPSAWIWAEASLPTKDVVLALAGGPTPVGPWTVPNAWLIGYRSPAANLSFHPQDLPIITSNPDACNGVFTMSASGPVHRLEIAFKASPDSFTRIPCPTEKGFAEYSVESYSSVANVYVYERGIFGEAMIDSQEIPNAAIEFGGKYRCPTSDI